MWTIIILYALLCIHHLFGKNDLSQLSLNKSLIGCLPCFTVHCLHADVQSDTLYCVIGINLVDCFVTDGRSNFWLAVGIPVAILIIIIVGMVIVAVVCRRRPQTFNFAKKVPGVTLLQHKYECVFLFLTCLYVFSNNL